MPGVRTDYFVHTGLRRTFTYCKPLLVEEGKAPVELNRLDSKNWTPTPSHVEEKVLSAIECLAPSMDAMILLDQVDTPETGVVTRALLNGIGKVVRERPDLLVIADSRRGLRDYPQVTLKMNVVELAVLTGTPSTADLGAIKRTASDLSRKHGRMVFVTLAERGLLGASPDGLSEHVAALPLRGEIDIVGAGDAVTANLTAALAAGAGLREAIEIANAAASVVIHRLGTTGAASVAEIARLL
jgi:bifunctional ADP-heptose synthase (sugar kinase/adenylyltransferase)